MNLDDINAEIAEIRARMDVDRRRLAALRKEATAISNRIRLKARPRGHVYARSLIDNNGAVATPQTKVCDMSISPRTTRALYALMPSAETRTLLEVSERCSFDDVLGVRGVGRKSAVELAGILLSVGIEMR